jgi:competence protein CoiA
MLYAILNDIKCAPTPKKRGACPYCHNEVYAKCGTHNIWHWAHVSEVACDPWSEGETDWHRCWKQYFPKECQEVIFSDPVTKEKHVADVKTLNETVIEFQNSSMSIETLETREAFYGKMFWIINGDKFKHNFVIGDKMPSPEARIMYGFKIIASNSKRRYSPGQFEEPNQQAKSLLKADPSGKLLLQKAIEQGYDGHRLFLWKHPRTTWYHAKNPVIIDFGETGLFLMLQYPGRSFFVVKEILKEELIRKNGGTLRKDVVDL